MHVLYELWSWSAGLVHVSKGNNVEPLVMPVVELVQELYYVAGGTGICLLLIATSVIGTWCRHCRQSSPSAGTTITFLPAASEIGTSQIVLPTAPKSRERYRSNVAVLRTLVGGLGLAGIASVGLLVAVEFLGTEPTLSWAFKRLQARTGIAITFDRASGGPLRGEYVLHGVRAVRENDVHSNFDLRSSAVTVRFSLLDLLWRKSGLDEVRVDQVTGTYDKSGDRGGLASGSELSKDPRRERNILIRRLAIFDATLNYTDSSVKGEPVKFDLVLESLQCVPFNTAFAAHDIIFRSNVVGTIDQQRFSIESQKSETGVKTVWKATGLPVRFARSYLHGPFRLLRAGDCDIHVVQNVPDDRKSPAVLDSHLKFRAISAGLPDDVKPAVAVAAQILMTQLKRVPRQMDLDFTLKLDQDKFDLTTTEDLYDVWIQFRGAAVSSLLKTTGLKLETVSDGAGKELDVTVDQLTEKAFQILEKARERRKAKKAEKQKAAAPNP